MTGAGSAEVAFRLESEYLSPGTGDWYQPGMNISVGDLSIENNQQRNRQPDDPTPDGSRAGNFRGSASVEFDLTDDNWHDLLPLDGNTLSGDRKIAPSAEWYFSVDAVDDAGASFSEHITAAGAAVTDAEINWSQGEAVSISLTIGFGSVSGNSPDTIVQPSNADIYTHHGTTISVGTREQSGAQSATLSLSGLARPQEQQDREPLRYVVGAIEPSFSTDALFTESDQLEAALGGSTTSVADTIAGEASGAFEHQNGNGDTITYGLTQLDPQTYSWAALVDPGTDLTEPVDYHVSDVSVDSSTTA